MFKLFKYLKPYWWQVLILLAMNGVTVWTTLQLPNIMARIINEGIISGAQDIIINNGLEMLLITLVGGVSTIVAGFFSARIGTGVGKDMRADVFKKVNDFSLTEINKFSTASLITRSTNDVQQVQQVSIMLLAIALRAPIMAVGAIGQAMTSAPSMTWIIGLSVAALMTVIVTLIIIAMPKFKIRQKAVDKLNLVARENLTGLRVVRAFNNEKIEEKKFKETASHVTKIQLFVGRVMNFMQPSMTLIFSFTTLAIIWFGAHYVDAGSLEIGSMMAFMQYATQVIMSFLLLTMIFVMLPQANVSAQRINEVLDTKPSIHDPKNKKELVQKGVVEFKDVSFSYPGAEDEVLQNISFRAEPGKTTAFIGSTGSGKSTLINLVPRFFDATKGSIEIDGENVKNFTHEQLVGELGYVPQKGVLFTGTIESNLKFGNPKATQAQINKAVKIAQAEEFVNKFAEGLEHEISQGGKNVSGGQKQRLSIARAIIRDPKIYIFDDSFSALDYKTDQVLRKELKKVTKDSTVLIVGQRINTIKDADQIVVLDEGKVSGIGTHHELLLNCPTYLEIAESQFSESELQTEIKNAKGTK